jgi:hypothetical protein
MSASQILTEVYQAHVEHFGEPDESWVFDDGKNGGAYPDRIDVLVWRPTDECEIATFATIGMSDRPMIGAAHRAELHFAIKARLEQREEHSIARFLANLAMYPFQIGSFLDWWHTISQPGVIPFFSRARCVLLHPEFVRDGWSWIETSVSDVRILNVVPITEEEEALKEKSRIADALSVVDILTPR